MATMTLTDEDKDVIVGTIGSVRQFLLETPPENMTMQDVKDVFDDVLRCLSLVVTGEP